MSSNTSHCDCGMLPPKEPLHQTVLSTHVFLGKSNVWWRIMYKSYTYTLLRLYSLTDRIKYPLAWSPAPLAALAHLRSPQRHRAAQSRAARYGAAKVLGTPPSPHKGTDHRPRQTPTARKQRPPRGRRRGRGWGSALCPSPYQSGRGRMMMRARGV